MAAHGDVDSPSFKSKETPGYWESYPPILKINRVSFNFIEKCLTIKE